MKPYYGADGITIFHGDCREYFEQMKRARAQREAMRTASKSPSSDDVMSLIGLADWEAEAIDFDLCLTDPPYGMNYIHGAERGPNASKFNNCPVIGDAEPFDPAFLLEQEKLILWGGNHFADRLPANAGWLIWDKRCNTVVNDQSDCEMAWTNFLTTARLYYLVWDGFRRGGGEKAVPRQHPTQKPVDLMKWCLSFAPEAKTVIDPFMGSGSVLVAAKHRGLTAVGIDLEERYCEIAAKRLSQKVLNFD